MEKIYTKWWYDTGKCVALPHAASNEKEVKTYSEICVIL